MLFWNKRKVYHGFIIFEQDRISEILSTNNIRYHCKFVNKSYKIKTYKQTFNINNYGMNLNYEKEFYIYVANSDYDRTKDLLKNEFKKHSSI